MINANRFRIIQTLASITIFLGVFFICWHFTKFKIEDIQLSYWGVENKISWLWNSCLAIFSLSICYNTFNYIKDHPRLKFKEILQGFFIIVFISLFLTAIINMSHGLHNITAYFYFFAYPMAIFSLAHLNRKTLQYKEWLTHVVISTCMVIIPLILTKLFNGMAIAETAHGIIAIVWNLWILLDD